MNTMNITLKTVNASNFMGIIRIVLNETKEGDVIHPDTVSSYLESERQIKVNSDRVSIFLKLLTEMEFFDVIYGTKPQDDFPIKCYKRTAKRNDIF